MRVSAGLLLIVCLSKTSFATEEELISLTGDSSTGQVVAIDASGAVRLRRGRTHLDELREIRQTVRSSNDREPSVVVDFVDRSRLFVESVAIVDENCVVSGHPLGKKPLRVPLDSVLAIQLRPSDISDDLQTSLVKEHDDDELHLLVDGLPEAVSGLIEALDDNEMKFVLDGQTRRIPRANVVAIAVASTAAHVPTDRKCLIQFFDGGSEVWAKIQELRRGVLTIEVADQIGASIEWRDVRCIRIRSDRLQFVSELTPLVAEHHPIVTLERSWQKDRNVAGGVLTLGDKTFEKGVGVAANSRLLYQLDGDFAHLSAIVGIDAGTNGRGSCIFLVRGDGRVLAREAMKGTDGPRKLHVIVDGVKQLELIVEAGPDLDLADHANWCDACLLRG